MAGIVPPEKLDRQRDSVLMHYRRLARSARAADITIGKNHRIVALWGTLPHCGQPEKADGMGVFLLFDL